LAAPVPRPRRDPPRRRAGARDPRGRRATRRAQHRRRVLPAHGAPRARRARGGVVRAGHRRRATCARKALPDHPRGRRGVAPDALRRERPDASRPAPDPAPPEHAAMTLTLFRHAARRLRREPAFAPTALLTLALGVGANVAVFAVVEAALLRPLPFADAERL